MACNTPVAIQPVFTTSGIYRIGNNINATLGVNPVSATSFDVVVTEENGYVVDFKQYDIFYVDGNTVYFGDLFSTGNDGSTSALRPTVLDDASPYIRQ